MYTYIYIYIYIHIHMYICICTIYVICMHTYIRSSEPATSSGITPTEGFVPRAFAY